MPIQFHSRFRPALMLMVLLMAATGCRRQTAVPGGLLAVAQQEMQSGDYNTARDTLIEAISLQPQSLTAHINLGLTYWELGDYTAAAAAFNRATELAPDDPRTWQLLAHLLLDSGNAEGAGEVLQQIDRASPPVSTLRALAALESGQTDAAQHHLERALDQDHFYAPALYNLAILYRDHLNTPVEALSTYRRFKDTAPDAHFAQLDSDAFLSLAPHEAPPPRAPEAPTPPKPIAEEIEAPADTLEEYPVETTSPEDTTSAPPSAPAAEPSSPSQTATPQQAVRLMLEAAERAAARGENDTALLTLKKAVQNHPDHPDAVWALAVFYDHTLEMKDRASGLYRTFVRTFPQDSRAATVRSTIKDTTDTTAKVRTSSVENYFRKGLDHYSRQEWDEAIVAYRQALSLDRHFASCAYNLGLAYKEKGDLEAAAAAFRHALNIEPEMIKSLYMLGLTEIDRGRNAEALAHLNRLISIQPDFAKAHYLLGMVYQDENRSDMAAIHFQRFLNLDPQEATAPQIRRWLEQYRRRAGNRDR